MDKFEKARLHVDMVEAASKAVIEVAWDKIRYDSRYFDYDDSEIPEWYNEEWLEFHVNAAGHEYLKMAKEIADQIDQLL